VGQVNPLLRDNYGSRTANNRFVIGLANFDKHFRFCLSGFYEPALSCALRDGGSYDKKRGNNQKSQSVHRLILF